MTVDRVLIVSKVSGQARPATGNGALLEMCLDVVTRGECSAWWVLLATPAVAAEAADLAEGETVARRPSHRSRCPR